MRVSDRVILIIGGDHHCDPHAPYEGLIRHFASSRGPARLWGCAAPRISRSWFLEPKGDGASPRAQVPPARQAGPEAPAMRPVAALPLTRRRATTSGRGRLLVFLALGEQDSEAREDRRHHRVVVRSVPAHLQPPRSSTPQGRRLRRRSGRARRSRPTPHALISAALLAGPGRRGWRHRRVRLPSRGNRRGLGDADGTGIPKSHRMTLRSHDPPAAAPVARPCRRAGSGAFKGLTGSSRDILPRQAPMGDGRVWNRPRARPAPPGPTSSRPSIC